MKNKIISLLLVTIMLLSATACTNAANDSSRSSEVEIPSEIEAQPESESSTESSMMDIDRFFGMTEVPDIPNVPVATLGEYTVLRSDYAYFFEQLRSNMEYSINANYLSKEEKEEFWDSAIDENGTTAREYLKKNALNAAKELVVVYALAMKTGTEVDGMKNQQSDLDVLALLSQFNSSEKEFADFFQITSQQYRDVNQRMNLVIKFREEAMGKFTVSEEDIKAAYSEASDYYDAVTVCNVFIACTDQMDPSAQVVAKATAEDIFKQLKEGKSIVDLVYNYSEDPTAQSQDGEITFTRGQMAEELDSWAFSAKLGDQTMLKTENGYYILELLAPAGFESARGEIDQDIRSGMFSNSIGEELKIVRSEDWELDQEAIDSVILRIEVY